MCGETKFPVVILVKKDRYLECSQMSELRGLCRCTDAFFNAFLFATGPFRDHFGVNLGSIWGQIGVNFERQTP